MKQRSFVMLKPDAVKRRLAGEVLGRFEKRGLKIIAAKMMIIDTNQAKKHYGEHSDKPFFNDLVDYITSGPVLATVIEGEECIALIRRMVGATNPQEADLFCKVFNAVKPLRFKTFLMKYSYQFINTGIKFFLYIRCLFFVGLNE